MTPERWKRVQDLYLRAIDAPSAARESFVRTEAGDDAELADEVLRMLAVATDRSAFVDHPAASLGQLVPAMLGPGDRLADRYVIVREVGAGGMGRVYEARDEQLGARVALKTIHPELAAIPKVLDRFKAEIQLSRQVTHPNVCRVFDLGVARHLGTDIHFLTMEFMEGETLASLLRREGRIAFDKAKPWIGQIAAGLGAAHQAGVVHRDLKSSNIFLTSDRAGATRAVVADFGVAGSFGTDGGAATRHTTTGWGVGTPAYMAPEQVMGGTVGPAADIYALGVVMYEMATGVLPYAGETPLQVAVRRVREKPAAPRSFQKDVDPRWESAILRCLETDPADRFASAADVAPALDTRTILPRLTRRTWRRVGAAALLAAALGGLGWMARGWRTSPPPSTEALSWYERRGMPALYEGNFQAAEDAFAQAVKAAPSFSAAHARLAEAQMEMERLDDARASLLAAMAAGGYRAGEQLHADSILAYLNREIPKAIGLSGRRAQEAASVDRPGALMDQARMLVRERRWNDAVPVYRELVKLDAGNRQAWILLGTALGQAKKEAESAATYAEAESLLRKFPDAGLAQDLAYYRATVAEMTGQGKLMLPLAEEAARLAAAGGQGYRLIRANQLVASVVGRQGDRDRAIQILQGARRDAEAQNLEFQAVRILRDLSLQFSAQSRVEEQVNMLREALTRADKMGAIRTQVVLQIDLAQALDRTDGAETDRLLDRAETLVKRQGVQDWEPYLMGVRARRYLNQGNQTRAVESYRRQEQAAERLGKPYERMFGIEGQAFLLRRARKFTAASEAYARARDAASALNDKSRTLVFRLKIADLHRHLGDYAAAKSEAAAACRDASQQTDRAECDYYELGIQAEEQPSSGILRQIDAGEKTARAARNENAVRDYGSLRCTVAGEWPDPSLAMRACGQLANGGGAGKLNALEQAAVKRALARAAYWSGDYSRALSLVTELESVKDESGSWEALLLRAAAEHKLGRVEPRRRGEIEASIQRFAADNGESHVAPYLNRRIFRGLLNEIGYPIPHSTPNN